MIKAACCALIALSALPATAQSFDGVAGRISLAGSRFVDNKHGYGLEAELEMNRARRGTYDEFSLSLRREIEKGGPRGRETELRASRTRGSDGWGPNMTLLYKGDQVGPVTSDVFLGYGVGTLRGDPAGTHWSASLAAGPRLVDPDGGKSSTELGVYANVAMRQDLGERVYLDAGAEALWSETGLRTEAELGANLALFSNFGTRLAVNHTRIEADGAIEEKTTAVAALTFSF